MVDAKVLKFKEGGKPVRADARLVKSSPRKLNLVIKAIRGNAVRSAQAFLSFCSRPVARDVRKVLDSAIANAENNYLMDIDSLYVKEAYVGKGMMLKRFSPRAKGRGVRIRKRFSKFTIILGEVEG